MLDKIALTLLIVGGINWGSVGLFQFDIVAFLAGGQSGIISRIIYDFSYGAPGDIGDLLWMIAYYTTDVLIGVAGYFVMLYIVRRLTLSSKTTK